MQIFSTEIFMARNSVFYVSLAFFLRELFRGKGACHSLLKMSEQKKKKNKLLPFFFFCLANKVFHVNWNLG